ncbi:hypothetical protein ACIA71_31065 [Streptomyces anulatus]|uniref:hypothetical protein n=1 Tax=Streptomyces anulatus TaxID=1892 RepID=UPI003795439B|nr:hypothetical protein OG536_32510 [Streptomyces anulatus]
MATASASRLLDRIGERAAGWWALILACRIGAYWITADGQNSSSLFHGGLFLHAIAAALLIACLVRAPHTPLGQILETLVENPIRFRSPWAQGRTGAIALLAMFIALVALWALIPAPRTGVGTVDVTRLVPGEPGEPKL